MYVKNMSRTSSGTALTSPDKRSPCTRGKTVRDFEEELSELKRENFDLKMRIYIMEEQQDLFQGVENIDEIYEINTTLKKEVDSYKKEMSNKDDLILKAGDAMNMLVSKHREEVGLLRMQAHAEVEYYRERMEILHQELVDIKEKAMTFPQQSKLDDSSMIFTLPYKIPVEKSTFESSMGVSFKLSEMEAETKEKNRLLEEAAKTIDKLNRELSSLKEMENSLRSEIVTKGGQISILQNELAERDIDIQALKKQVLLFETKLNEYAVKDQSAKQEQLTSELQKLQVESQSNYIKLKTVYDSTRQENGQLSNQIVELHKRINELQTKLQGKEALNMDMHQQLELLKTKNCELLEEARMLRVVSDEREMECASAGCVTGNGGGNNIHGPNATARSYRKLSEIPAFQELTQKLREKEHELKKIQNELYNNKIFIQKLMKQNKTLTKDIENMKVNLEKKELHHANVEHGRGEKWNNHWNTFVNTILFRN